MVSSVKLKIFLIILIFTCVNVMELPSKQMGGEEKLHSSSNTQFGNLYVTKWADDRQSAFSFSFDDGFISHYNNVKNIFNQYGFKATFYIIPPSLNDTLPGIWRYGTWPMFEMMQSEGHELGSHTLTHPHLKQMAIGDTSTQNTIIYELYHSRRMIEERISSTKCITFAYPFGEHNDLIDSIASLYYESARALGLQPNNWTLNSMDWFKLNSGEVHFDEPRNSFDDDLEELYDFINWIEGSIESESWAIQLAHEVVPFSELEDLLLQGSYYPISNEWLELLCGWLKTNYDENKIWIETVANITRYIKQRDNYTYQVISQSQSEIIIELTDSLDDEIYNYPLSAYINIPMDWMHVLIEQGTQSEVLESFVVDTSNFILAAVIPDGGLINLTKFEPNVVADNENPNPQDFILYQNYPNPFNPSTTISYELLTGGYISLEVYDVLGNKINSLVDEFKTAGRYSVNFNAGNLASGVYNYVLRSESKFISKKMLLVK